MYRVNLKVSLTHALTKDSRIQSSRFALPPAQCVLPFPMGKPSLRNTPTSRDLQAQQTKERLLTAAVSLVKEHGYQKVSVQQICRQASVAKGTFYLYFNSKSEIIFEILSELNKQMFSKKAWQSDLSPKDKLLDYVCYYLNFVTHQGVDLSREILRIILGEGPDPAQVGSLSHEQRIAEILTQGLSQSFWALSLSVEDTTDIIQSMLFGLVMSWCSDGGEFDICKRGAQMMEIFLSGLELPASS